jgi:hypothetical protein
LTLELLCLEQQETIEKLTRMSGALLLEVIQHRELSEEEARVLASAEELGKEVNP